MELITSHSEWLSGLLGGLLIGLAAALMLLGAGRIMGISGLAARAFGLSASSETPRNLAWAFVLGMPLGFMLAAWLAGPAGATFPMGLPVLAAAGLAVGFGTHMASGCTSGHGVCGLSRLSPRSIAATLAFMAAAFATVAIVNALGGGW
jgi:uncharacterized membrane protein YedE/YeeE